MHFLELLIDVKYGLHDGLQDVNFLLVLFLLAVVDLYEARLLVTGLFHDLLFARLLPLADLHVEHGQPHVEVVLGFLLCRSYLLLVRLQIFLELIVTLLRVVKFFVELGQLGFQFQLARFLFGFYLVGDLLGLSELLVLECLVELLELASLDSLQLLQLLRQLLRGLILLEQQLSEAILHHPRLLVHALKLFLHKGVVHLDQSSILI